MKKLLFILGILFVYSASAQVQKFRKIYGGTSYDYGMDVVQLPDSGYLLLGTSSSFSGSSDIYLLRVDKYGNFKWHHAYGSNNVEWGYSLKATRDSGFVIAGYTNSIGNGGYDFYLMKVDSIGTKLWEKTYGGSDWEFGYSVDTTNDGGYILTGSTLSYGKGNTDVYIVKTNSVGDTLWTKTMGGTGEDIGKSLVQSRFDSTYAICGYTNSFGSPMHDVYIIHLKNNGDTIMSKHFGTADEDFGRCVIFSNDSAFAIAGYSNGYLGASDFSGMLWKLNKNMNQQWVEYPGQAVAQDIMNDLWQRPDLDSCYVVAGETSFNNYDFAIYEIDKNGYFAFANTHGNLGVDKSNAFVHCLDGGFAQIGTSTSYATGLENILFLKSDSLFVSSPNPIVFLFQEEEAMMAADNSVYPNPFYQQTKIQSNVPYFTAVNEKLQFVVYSITGQNVTSQLSYTMKESDGKLLVEINENELSQGMYFYSLLSKSHSITSGKLVVLSEE